MPAWSTSAHAQGVSAVTFTGGTNNNVGSTYTLGYAFTVNDPAFVTALGYSATTTRKVTRLPTRG